MDWINRSTDAEKKADIGSIVAWQCVANTLNELVRHFHTVTAPTADAKYLRNREVRTPESLTYVASLLRPVGVVAVGFLLLFGLIALWKHRIHNPNQWLVLQRSAPNGAASTVAIPGKKVEMVAARVVPHANESGSAKRKHA